MRIALHHFCMATAICGLFAATAPAQTGGFVPSQPQIRATNFASATYYKQEEKNGKTPSPSPSEPAMGQPMGKAPCEPVCSAPCDNGACDDPCDDNGSCDDPCGNDCCSCYVWGPSEAWTLTNDCSPITVGGWISAGYHSGDTTLFNNRPDEFNWHQIWLYSEKVADGSCGLDWGYRADMMYGIDGTDTQAFGNNPGNWDYLNGYDHGAYSWAFPQLYAEAAAGDWNVKAGHFFTLVGYEVVPAPDNFFYSHALTMYNSEPFTHTGVLATYSGYEGVTLYGGWTLGWDTGFDQNNGGNSFLGGASFDVTDSLNLTYINTFGNLGARGHGYTHSVVANYAITESLNYIFHSDLVSTNTGIADDQYSINQYLLYAINDCWGVGARGEWWKSDGVSFYEITYGVNYRPMANFILRPEIRHQWSPSAAADFADNSLFGMDGILTF